MNTAKELNKLCKVMTGKDSNATTDAQAIKNIANNYTGGGGEPYVLPTASASTLGGIKVGSGLAIEDGVLSASGGGQSTYIVIPEALYDSGDAVEIDDTTYPEIVSALEEIKDSYPYPVALTINVNPTTRITSNGYTANYTEGGDHVITFTIDLEGIIGRAKFFYDTSGSDPVWKLQIISE